MQKQSWIYWFHSAHIKSHTGGCVPLFKYMEYVILVSLLMQSTCIVSTTGSFFNLSLYFLLKVVWFVTPLLLQCTRSLCGWNALGKISCWPWYRCKHSSGSNLYIWGINWYNLCCIYKVHLFQTPIYCMIRSEPQLKWVAIKIRLL